jgi:hypothetical protein
MKKGWISGLIFSDWFTGQLHSEFKEYCKAESIDFSSLLVSDIVAGHPPVMQALSTHICCFCFSLQHEGASAASEQRRDFEIYGLLPQRNGCKAYRDGKNRNNFLILRHHRHYS